MKRNALIALALAAVSGACTIDEDTPDQGREPGTTSRQVSAPDYEAMEAVSDARRRGIDAVAFGRGQAHRPGQREYVAA